MVNWLSRVVQPSSTQQAFLGNLNAQSFYSNVVSNLIFFVLSPVLFLYVFYRLGSKEADPIDSRYLSVLKSSFTGGLVGYVLGYALSVALISATQGGYSNGEPWYIFFPGFGISLIRESVIMAAFAFTGVYLGYLRARRKNGSSNSTYPVLNDSPHPQVDTALGLLTTNPPPISFSDL